MAMVAPKDVEFLVFGGGGGRGWAHIGALTALETLAKRTPIAPPGKPENVPIRGVAGASVGAFVAMCVALGASAPEIKDIAQKGFLLSNLIPIPKRGNGSRNFTGVPWLLYDELVIQRSRRAGGSAELGLTAQPIIRDGKYKTSEERPSPHLATMTKDDYYRWSVYDILGVGTSASSRALADAAMLAHPPLDEIEKLRIRLDDYVNSSGRPRWVQDLRVFTRDEKLFRVYLANLQGHLGLLPGFALREIVTMAATRLAPKANIQVGEGAADLTFRTLHKHTGIELSVTGTHMGSGRSREFSYRATPEFGVVPAVCLSMAFPLLFKPVMVSQNEKQPIMPPSYVGLWTDGGMTNNLPLRAFPPRGTRTLNPRTVAFALDSPQENPSGNSVQTNLARVFREYSRVILGASYKMQLDLETDEAQVVRLDAPKLETFDIVFDGRAEGAIKAAEAKVHGYFTAEKPVLFPTVAEWARRTCEHRDFAIEGDLFETVARTQFRSRFPFVSPDEVTFHPFNDDMSLADEKCKVDIVVGSTEDPAKWKLVEAKGSITAPLSERQRDGFPLLKRNGGILINDRDPLDLEWDKEWAPFRNGIILGKREVIIVMPGTLRKYYEDIEKELFPNP